MAEHIVRDGETGQAVVASTGTPVEEILEALETGGAFGAVVRRFPELTPAAVAAALRFARVAVGRETRFHLQPHDEGVGVRERSVQPFNAPPQSGGTVTLDADPELDTALRAAEAQRDRLVYELDVAESIVDGLRQAIAGEVIPHEEVFARLRERFPG